MKFELHAVRAELDGDQVEAAAAPEGEFAAGQEAGLLAGQRHQVRACARVRIDALFLQRRQLGVDGRMADRADVAESSATPCGRSARRARPLAG